MTERMQPWTLAGKRVVVTGGTRGIGEAVVRECLLLGAEVLLVARQADAVAQTVAMYRAQGYGVDGVAADVATTAGRAALIEALSWEALDVLVNNVGINVRKPTLAIAPDDFQAMITTNLEAAWELCRLLHPRLQATGSGSIVNVGSVAGQRAILTSTAVYSMTKAALEQMSRFLAVEWAPAVRVNTVLPWYTRTPLVEPVLADAEKTGRILARTPMQRLAEPDDVARAVCFLAMPASAYITGVSLPVDGGFLATGI